MPRQVRRVLLACAASGGLLAGSPPALADTPLIQALKSGNSAAAERLLEQNLYLNATEPDGTTALHWAVRNDELQLTQRLLDAGADPRAANRYGVTPLHLAAVNGSAQLIEALLAAGADANEVGNEGETVLMTAARTGVVDAARVLLDAGAQVDARERWLGQTALMWAAGQGHADMLRELIAHGADVNARSAAQTWERQVTAEPREKWLPPGSLTPLLFAAREGCLPCVPVLAEAGADIDAATPDGITPLISSLINGHYDVAGRLIELGADPNLADSTGRTPLYAAVDFNTMPQSARPPPDVLRNELTSMDIVERLLAAGANVNAQLLKMAPYRAKLDRGNDVMLGSGTTPFLRAAKAGDIAAMQVLLAHGADPALGTSAGINPLMAAAGVGTREEDSSGRLKTQAQAVEAIRICLERGLDINAADKRGQTALHGAALRGYEQVVRFLAEHGADLQAKDGRGYTPLDFALGKAGGYGFAGADGVVQEAAARAIEELLAARTPLAQRQ